MKTFQKLLTNSLLFAENRLCRKEGAEKPATTLEQGFEIDQVVEGYGLTKEDNVTVEKIEKVHGYDKVTLSDKTVIERVRFEFKKDGKNEPTWLTCRKLNTGTYVDIDGEQPLEFTPSQKDLMPESEAIKQLEEKANEAKKKLEEAKKKALENISEPNKEQATQAIEEKYKKAAEKIDKLLGEAKAKIEEEKNDEGNVIKGIAEELAKTFDVDVKKASEEGEKEMGFEAEFKGKLKNPEDLHEWLKSPGNRERMRDIVLVGNVGAKKYTVDFGKLKTALNLDNKEYKIAERNLRIGNLLEDDVIKKITSVKTKGKEMVAKYFYEGGEKVKGIYTEKNKYIPIWDGTEISIEPAGADLETVKGGDKDFEKKVTKAGATPQGGGDEPESAASSEPAEGKAAEPAPGTPEAKAEAEKAEAAAATSPESRTAQGLDSTPVKPLEPTESKDVASAKEFNDITYKPNGANFDIIDKTTKKVTNTVDATTLAVLEGREIPTEKWMKAKIYEAFPYLKPDIKFEYYLGQNGADSIRIDAIAPSGVYFSYTPSSGTKDGAVMDSRYGKPKDRDLSEYLADTNASTIAQLCFDARVGKVTKENFKEEIKDKLAEKIINKEWVAAAELLADQPDPDPKTLALIMALSEKDDVLSKVNRDKLPILKSKIGAAKIIQIWKENGKKIYKVNLDRLELLNGGDLDPALQEAVMDCGLANNTEAEKAFYEKYKSNPKVAEWYLKEGGETGADLLLLIKDYTGELGDEAVIKLVDSYSEIDSLSLKDEEKTALKEKCKKIFANYLAACAKDGPQEGYQEIYAILYDADITKLPDGALKPSPEVFAASLVLANQSPFAAGVFDGAGWLAFDSQETNKYISAYLDAMTTLPSSIPTEQPDPAKEKSVASIIMELAKQSKNSLAQVLAAKIELNAFALVEGREANRLEEIKNLKKIAENTEDQNALTAIDTLEQLGGNIEEILKTEAGRTALGFENKDKFDTWLGKQKALIQFTQGDFEHIDEDQLDDPAQKEAVWLYNDPKDRIESIAQIHRIAKVISPESLKKLSEKEFVSGWKSIELYLALGLKGKAKEVADGMTDEVEKNYYLAMFAETKEDKLKFLEKAISEVVPRKEDQLEAVDLELRAKILKELKNAGKMPDQYRYKGANVSILENLAGIPMASDPDKKDFYNAVLDIKLLNAETEIAQCEDPSNPFASDHDGACDYKELVNEVKAYNESLPEGQEMDKAMLERLHELIGANTDLIKDEDTKKAYASLMVKIDKAEGLEDYITQDAAYLESKGKFLDAAKAIIDTAKPEDLSKKKELLAKALTAVGEDADKKAEIAAEYATFDDQESQEKAVDTYLGAGKYDEAANLMKADNKITEGFIKAKIDDFVNNDQASLAEGICAEKKLYVEIIRQIYMKPEKSKDFKIDLDAFIGASANNKDLNDALVDLIFLNDGRTKDDFEISKDSATRFVRRNLDKFKNDTTKKIVKNKLSEEVFNELGKMQNDHSYSLDVDKKEVSVNLMDGEKRAFTYDIPSGMEVSVVISSDGDEFVNFSDNSGNVGHAELDENEKVTASIHEGYKSTYKAEIAENKVTITKTEQTDPTPKPPTTEPPAAQPPVQAPIQAPVKPQAEVKATPPADSSVRLKF